MSAELAARYRTEAERHARLAETYAVAAVMDGADVSEEIRDHNHQRDAFRRQASALEADPAAWVRTGPAWLD